MRMWRYAAAVLLILSVFLGRPALAGARVALVIGNSAYKHVAELVNPRRDARALAGALRALGYDVTLKTDLGYEGMRKALRAFSRKTPGAEVALLFYAGHGMEAGGVNYLIPVDAELKVSSDLEFEAISLNQALSVVDGARRLKIVMLDACRDNPFAQRMKRAGRTRSIGRGLARVEPAGGNILVAYAARAGTTADDGDGAHSPFTQALLNNLSAPGLDVRLMLGKVRDEVRRATGGRQEPFINGSLGGEPVSLAPAMNEPKTENVPGSVIPEPTSPLSPGITADGNRDALFWASIKDSGNPAMFEAYLKTFPNGAFVPLARMRLRELKSGKIKPTVTLCDRLVAKLDDERQQAAKPGRDGAQQVIAACREEVGKYPDNPELWRWFGRALDIGGEYTEAARWYRKAAKKGDANAMNYLGVMYEDGHGVEKSYPEAVHWYRKAAEKGSVSAMNNLGVMYAEGRGVGKSYPEALRWCRKAAEKGNASAMNNLGVMYAEGHGVRKSYPAALRWYRKAAEKGEANAMNHLGIMHAMGRGVGKSHREALRWFRKAAKKGHSGAMYNLGVMYEKGAGVARDPRMAAEWVFKAVRKGNKFVVKKITSDSTAWSRVFRRALQQKLQEAGVYDGSVDGSFGPATRRAIRALAGQG